MDGAVTFDTSSGTAAFRLATYLRSLRRPKALVVIAVLALFPVALERGVSLVLPGPGLDLPFLAIGAAVALLLVAFGALAALLGGGRPRAITFDDDGIVERVGKKTIPHPWAWVLAVVQDEGTITLYCERPMRSFRLSTSADALVLVLDKGSPGVDRLLALLDAHAPGVRLG